jgi:hypothetical protein
MGLQYKDLLGMMQVLDTSNNLYTSNRMGLQYKDLQLCIPDLLGILHSLGIPRT